MMMMNTQRQKQNVQKLPDLQLEQTNQQANLKKLSLDPHLVLLRKCRSDVSYHVCIYFVAEILQFRGLWFFVFMHFETNLIPQIDVCKDIFIHETAIGALYSIG